MKTITSRFALIVFSLLVAASASAQRDTINKPIPDTAGKPVPGDNRMPKKDRSKDKRKMPKDTMKLVIPNQPQTATFRAASFAPLALAANKQKFVSTKVSAPIQ